MCDANMECNGMLFFKFLDFVIFMVFMIKDMHKDKLKFYLKYIANQKKKK